MEPAPKCFTCGNDLINNPDTNWDIYYERFDAAMETLEGEGTDIRDEKVILYIKGTILDSLGYNRMCCRRMFLGDTRELRNVLRLYIREY